MPAHRLWVVPQSCYPAACKGDKNATIQSKSNTCKGNKNAIIQADSRLGRMLASLSQSRASGMAALMSFFEVSKI